MATNLNISENQERVPLTIGNRTVLRTITPDNGSPYYVGARAYVTQTASGATVTVIDKDGTTTAVILNGTNGINGQDGADGADGNGIASIDLTSTVGNVDTYTITYDDGTTDTFEVTNGVDGTDGVDGADGYSPTATVTKSGDTATISITDENGTTTATVSDGTDGQDGQDGRDGVDGTDGADGVGIVSITKTATVGLVDTYTILYSDGTTSTFDVTNGQNGSGSVADVWVDGVSVLDDDTAKIDLTGKSDVGHTHTKSAITDFPTDVSSFVNDSGYITSPNVVYCTCSTAAATAAKVATIETGSLASLNEGDQAIVKFTNANGVASPTLKIGTTDAKSIKRYGTTAPSTSAGSSWNAGSAILFVYDGTYWQMIGYLNTTYSEISEANITNGSNTSTGLITGRRAKKAVETFAPVQSVNGNTGAVTITVPTKTSDLNNDSGFITGYTETDPIFSASAASGISSSDISNWNGKLDATGILNLFYPVGSYYETSDTSFNPNVSWGGTWSLEIAGQVHISAGTGYAVAGALTNTSDGGAATVTLNSTQIPSHSHTPYNGSNYAFVETDKTATLSRASTSGTSNANFVKSTASLYRHETTGSTGGGQAHNNMQPYIIVNRWHRTA